MSRYRGSHFKKIHRLGSDFRNQSRSEKISQYRICLEEKQKLCFHYGLTKCQLLNYVRIATGRVLLQLLEMRLNNILFRLGKVADSY